MTFTPQSLLTALPAPDCDCLVAYSGGRDSHVLLHALSQLHQSGDFTGRIRAVHVHHGLNENADAWAEHCQQVCNNLGISLEVVKVQVTATGKGIEDAARQARLVAFMSLLHNNEFLLTGHHLDDQAETLLFRMLRGTGLRGLAGISRRRPLGEGMLARPLLDIEGAALQDYATRAKLQWVSDDSNADTSLDRNYLRHKIMPLLATRWPGFQASWQRLSRLAGEGEQLARELGDLDLAQVQCGLHCLSMSALSDFSIHRQRNILRTWFLGFEQSHGLPVPDSRVIEHILTELLPAAIDGQPVIAWGKGEVRPSVRRFDGKIYLWIEGEEPACNAALTWPWHKHPHQPFELPAQLGRLEVKEVEGQGMALPESALAIRFRQGGESAKPAGRKTRPLKKLLQDYKVPPWLRSRIPLLYLGDELIAVGDLFVCEGWQRDQPGDKGEKNVIIRWHREDLHCGY